MTDCCPTCHGPVTVERTRRASDGIEGHEEWTATTYHSAPPSEALRLLNSLGIAGSNIPHRIETAEDRADPKRTQEERNLDAVLDGEWCVCGRIWPCEAKRLADLLASSDRDASPATPDAGPGIGYVAGPILAVEQAATPDEGGFVAPMTGEWFPATPDARPHRGTRSTGTDDTDTLRTEVDVVAWDDGSYTVAEVRQDRATLRTAAKAVIAEWARGPLGYTDEAHETRMRDQIEALSAALGGQS